MIALFLALTLLVGCGSGNKAAVRADGSKYQVACLIDDGVTAAMLPDTVNQYRQVASWMENDLVRLLTRAGYQVRPIQSRSDYAAAPGSYLLQARITNYNPGSKAARMLVGFGAGATSLDIEYQIINGQGQQLYSKADGIGSGRDWTFCCRALNERMVSMLGTQIGL
ncbi:MAG: DUF4410 domain-containing protein [Desulfuromonadaceae bacterium]|nr:DUF4410 domain-containing protein [Desulfuromonadaceae bacterium]